MAIKVQYNKTFLQQVQKQLRIRVNALPTLQAKESALRLEVKKAKGEVTRIEDELEEARASVKHSFRLWTEFPEGLLSVKNVEIDISRIAGVKTPVFKRTDFAMVDFSLFVNAGWVPEGVAMLKKTAALTIERAVAERKVEILEYARKKTTQKVNLYEKVQIPEFNEAILKIKRFLEDEENLAKSSQKILKERMAAAEAA
ncbi:MAG: V-type ATP synthase subunit D [Chitinivibrionales bacterium]|nr:V-type ATP synthase subunit D [Chitinivibrionales bacterium]MBD3395837.1 V-type ATP synthase subunit D [Chitinivibrionales bacterium]